MKVAIQSPYLNTMGGGERYVFTVAEFFLKRGDLVDIFWQEAIDLQQIKLRFAIDLSRARFLKSGKSQNYDLAFFLSDGSLPFSFAKKTIIHFQQPFKGNHRSILNKLKLLKVSKIICNSNFTKKFIDESYGVKSEVLHPPVDTDEFQPGEKEKLIISVGRFFSSHPKNQEFLIDQFKKITGWRFTLIGGVAPEEKEKLSLLMKSVTGTGIEIMADASINTLKINFAKAKIFWHAAGYGQNLEAEPIKAEHFGISTVEAMSAGCVPIVFAGGGQTEIIEDGVNGFLWKTPDELINKTKKVIADDHLAKKLSENAIKRSKDFSKSEFFKGLEKVIA